jgi:hypothetical protein
MPGKIIIFLIVPASRIGIRESLARRRSMDIVEKCNT